jgi:hypothetical protein
MTPRELRAKLLEAHRTGQQVDLEDPEILNLVTKDLKLNSLFREQIVELYETHSASDLMHRAVTEQAAQAAADAGAPPPEAQREMTLAEYNANREALTGIKTPRPKSTE